MGWKEVKNRISTPILTSDGISAMVDSCLKKDGNNTKHSRTIMMDDYKSPTDDYESVSATEIEEIKFGIIRHMAQSLLRDCDVSDPQKRVSQFISGWEEKNPGSDVTIGELQTIATMSDEEIREYIENKSGFVYKVYVTSCNLEEEHNGVNPVYPFERTSNQEKNTLWGYNKRIYLHPSLNNISTYKFLAEYIKKCIDKRIPFDMKGFGSLSHSESQLDGMILYSSNQHFDQHLTCLEEVIQENPEIMSTFGSPIYTGAKVTAENGESYYTIGAGYPCRGNTYNDYIDSAINTTYLIASAKLIKQYFPVIASDYRELDEETRTLINKLNNLEQCTPEELRRIGKEQKEAIRNLAYKIITHKREKGTEQEKEEVMGRLKSTFSDNFMMICSVLKFNDKEHISTPIYADESFVEFEQKEAAKDTIGTDDFATKLRSGVKTTEEMAADIELDGDSRVASKVITTQYKDER